MQAKPWTKTGVSKNFSRLDFSAGFAFSLLKRLVAPYLNKNNIEPLTGTKYVVEKGNSEFF
jgi:hypothetical protein